MKLREDLEQLKYEMDQLKQAERGLKKIWDGLAQRGLLNNRVEDELDRKGKKVERALERAEGKRKRVVREARERLAAMLGYADPENDGKHLAELSDRELVDHTEVLLQVESLALMP